MNPVGFPILIPRDAREILLVLLKSRHDGLVSREAGGANPFDSLKDALVILGNDANKLRDYFFPSSENFPGPIALGQLGMITNA